MSFWLLVAGLLMLASFFLIYPFVRKGQSSQNEVLETNLQIFRDQQSQLDYQLHQKQINQAQYDQLTTESKQLLLNNTESSAPQQSIQLAKKQATWILPVVLLLMPLFCISVYQSIGASDDQHILALIQQASESKIPLNSLRCKISYTRRWSRKPSSVQRIFITGFYWLRERFRKMT